MGALKNPGSSSRLPSEAEPGLIDRALSQAVASAEEHRRNLLAGYQQLRESHQSYLENLRQVEAALTTEETEASARLDSSPRSTEAIVEAVRRQAQIQALRQRHTWLAEELVRIAAAARKLQAVARQAELTGGYLSGDLDEGGGSADLAELAQVSALQAQEEERRRLAREVHDGPAQVLANAIFEIEYCRQLVGRDSEKLAEALERLVRDLRDSLGEVRQLIYDLRPGSLAELGLVATLRQYLDEFTVRTGMAGGLESEPPDLRLPTAVELGAFRIVQEALQNARKHSQATTVRIQLRRVKGDVRVTVQDDGVGFNPKSAESGGHHYGILSMMERARLLHADLSVESSPGQGTKISLLVSASELPSQLDE